MNRIKESQTKVVSTSDPPMLKIGVFRDGERIRTIEVEDPREVICRTINELDSEFTAVAD